MARKYKYMCPECGTKKITERDKAGEYCTCEYCGTKYPADDNEAGVTVDWDKMKTNY